METIVAFLISWTVNKAQRVLHRIDERTNAAVDAAVDRVWNIIAAKLGIHPAIAGLHDEASARGAVSVEVRGETERVLQAAVDQDPRFAHDLRAAVLDAMNVAASTPAATPPIRDITGNYVGTVVAGGSVKINQRIVNYARRHPLPFAAMVVTLVVLLGWGGYGLLNTIVATTPSGQTGQSSTRVDDRSTPEAVTRSFAAALNAYDKRAAKNLTCPEQGKFVEDRFSILDTVRSGQFEDDGVVLDGLTITVVVQTVKRLDTPEENGATYSARLAWVASNIPETATAKSREQLSKPDDWGMGVRLESNGSWSMC